MNETKVIVKRDTNAWIWQTRISFGTAVALMSFSVMNVSGEMIQKLFSLMGILFVLFSTFSLSKTLRDNQYEKQDTAQWILTVWAGFISSVVLTGYGFSQMNLVEWQKWFLMASSLFLLSSSFTLSKMIRDKQEADLISRE